MSKKRWFYVLFFVFLAVGFFLIMSWIIPGYNERRVPPISYVRPFSFISQDGEIVTEKIMENKVSVVNFFFTTCKSVCPRMNNNLKPVYEAYKDRPDFIMISYTSDPAIDSPAVLKKYADSLGVNTGKWVFLTGRKDSLYRTARTSYKLDDPNNNVKDVSDEFLHTQFIALVNKKGAVIKIYDGLKPSEMEQLRKDVAKYLN